MSTPRLLPGAAIAVALCLPAAADGPRPSEGARARLEVRIDGLKSRHGSVALALFGDPESFERRSGAVQAEFVPLKKKRLAWVVEDLAPGSYAVVAYHDRNDNRELDRKPFGIPSEPYGFSNDARGSFGPPSFEAARFEVTDGPTSITIRLK